MQHYALDAIALQDWQQSQHIDDDGDEPMTPPAQPLDGATLAAVMMLLIPPMNDTGELSVGQVKFAARRLFVLAAIVCPEVGANGFTVIADALTKAGLSTTRACLSNIYVEIAKITGSTALGKAASAREAYAKRAVKVWAMRDRKPRKVARKGSQEQA
jgi:hypothetical protein